VVSEELARISSNLEYSLPNIELPIQGDDTCWSGGGGTGSVDKAVAAGRVRWAASTHRGVDAIAGRSGAGS
jgi:hypothetical protein